MHRFTNKTYEKQQHFRHTTKYRHNEQEMKMKNDEIFGYIFEDSFHVCLNSSINEFLETQIPDL